MKRRLHMQCPIKNHDDPRSTRAKVFKHSVTVRSARLVITLQIKCLEVCDLINLIGSVKTYFNFLIYRKKYYPKYMLTFRFNKSKWCAVSNLLLVEGHIFSDFKINHRFFHLDKFTFNILFNIKHD